MFKSSSLNCNPLLFSINKNCSNGLSYISKRNLTFKSIGFSSSFNSNIIKEQIRFISSKNKSSTSLVIFGENLPYLLGNGKIKHIDTLKNITLSDYQQGVVVGLLLSDG
jgi:hypothetical protein